MTKKHYEAIAAIIKPRYIAEWQGGDGFVSTEVLAHDLADYFEQDNPKFDRVRFLEACGIEQ